MHILFKFFPPSYTEEKLFLKSWWGDVDTSLFDRFLHGL